MERIRAARWRSVFAAIPVAAAVVVMLGCTSPLRAQSEVAAGDTTVRGDLVATGVMRYRLTGVTNGQSVDVGVMTQEVSAMEDGRLRVVQTTQSPRGPNTDTVIVARATMAPVSMSGHSEGGTMLLSFAGRRVTGTRTDSEGSAQAIDQTLAAPVFDSNIADLVVGALPLETGYRGRVPVYVFERGGLVWYEVNVAGEAQGEVVPAWLVDVTIPEGVVRYVIPKDGRRMLRAKVTFSRNDMVIHMVRVTD